MCFQLNEIIIVSRASEMLKLCYICVLFTNAVTEQSCDWLHLFGGHGFNSLGAGRARCSWVLWVVAQCLEKAIVKTPTL